MIFSSLWIIASDTVYSWEYKYYCVPSLPGLDTEYLFLVQVAMNLDASRTAAQQPAPSYPDVCFAADNFEDGIDEMVRRQYT